MKRIVTAAMVTALTGFLLQSEAAQAQTATSGARTAQASQPTATDASAQRRRPLRRVPIYRSNQWEPDVYPRYNPGPNAVRDCNATYVQGIPAEWHGDHAAHELLLAARLERFREALAPRATAPINPAPTTSAEMP